MAQILVGGKTHTICLIRFLCGTFPQFRFCSDSLELFPEVEQSISDRLVGILLAFLPRLSIMPASFQRGQERLNGSNGHRPEFL